MSGLLLLDVWSNHVKNLEEADIKAPSEQAVDKDLFKLQPFDNYAHTHNIIGRAVVSVWSSSISGGVVVSVAEQ
jgi:hypothetical protein